ncbi:MAG: DUF736 family protein [Pseudomonadota bacterium]
MINLAELRYREAHQSFDHLEGEFRSLVYDGPMEIKKDPKAYEPGKLPTHFILGRTQADSQIQIGVAWRKTVCNGKNRGNEYLSCLLRCPGINDPITFQVFHREEFAIALWNRNHADAPRRTNRCKDA